MALALNCDEFQALSVLNEIRERDKPEGIDIARYSLHELVVVFAAHVVAPAGVFFADHCGGEEIVGATVSTCPEKFQRSVGETLPNLRPLCNFPLSLWLPHPFQFINCQVIAPVVGWIDDDRDGVIGDGQFNVSDFVLPTRLVFNGFDGS